MKFKNFNINEKAQIPCCQPKSKMNKEQSYQKTDLVKKLIYIITSVQMEIESLEFILGSKDIINMLFKSSSVYLERFRKLTRMQFAPKDFTSLLYNE